MLSFQEARKKIIATVRALRPPLVTETIELTRACGRVLAEAVQADRDYPPFDRSIRDGFAVRADDARPGATLRCIGEIRAGSGFDGAVGAGECVRYRMTGAAVPAGADAVVMIEHVSVDGDRVMFSRATTRGQSIVPRGNEARAGQQLLAPGMRLGYAEMGLAGQVGKHRIEVYRRPRASILSTGDEVVDISATPGPLQVRNGNSVALGTLAGLAGAESEPIGNAPDEKKELRRYLERGLEADVLIISGGVSMGKYDLVEMVLSELGTEFLFDSVAVGPGGAQILGCARQAGIRIARQSRIHDGHLRAVCDAGGGYSRRRGAASAADLSRPADARGSRTRRPHPFSAPRAWKPRAASRKLRCCRGRVRGTW